VHPLIERMQGGLVVSCQASAADVIWGPDAMASMARAAEVGGAVGIRANGPRDIAAIRKAVKLPIIGIYKQDLPGYGIRITPSLEAAREIVEAGADIVALDATIRGPSEGRLPAAELIRQVKETLGVPVMADIATLQEGIDAAQAGVDIVASTLSGYTAYSLMKKGPDFELVAQLVKNVSVPVIAEGRIATPEQAQRILELGGFAVVVGSMITRPRWIVEHYVAALREFKQQELPVIAVDIGGTKIAYGVVKNGTEISQYQEIATQPQEGGAAVLDRVCRSIEQVLAQTKDASAIGVSATGEVDSQGKIIFSTDTLPGWQGIELRKEIEARFHLPTTVINDGHAAALAEALHGAGRGYRSVLAVTVGTGIGGGFVIDQTVPHSIILGHVVVEKDGRPCTCGKRGCLEQYASGPALVADYNARVPQDRQVTSGEAVMQAAQQGDSQAIAAIKTTGDWLGYGLSMACNLLNPSAIVVSGSVARIGELFLEPIRAAIQRHAYPTVRDVPVLAAEFGPQAGLIGAAATLYHDK
jgi:glucokinase-like ROK family protein